MGEFEDAYTVWRSRAFPQGSADDSLDELHADLALADTWVADSVIPYVKRGEYQPAQVDVVGELRELRNRAEQLRSRGTDKHAAVAASYAEYATILLHVYESFLMRGRPDP